MSAHERRERITRLVDEGQAGVRRGADRAVRRHGRLDPARPHPARGGGAAAAGPRRGRQPCRQGRRGRLRHQARGSGATRRRGSAAAAARLDRARRGRPVRLRHDRGPGRRPVPRRRCAAASAITAVTYSLPVIDEIGGWESPHLVSSVGCTSPTTGRSSGPQAIAGLRELTADVIFLGCDGLTVESGLTTPHVLVAEIGEVGARARTGSSRSPTPPSWGARASRRSCRWPRSTSSSRTRTPTRSASPRSARSAWRSSSRDRPAAGGRQPARR